MDAVGTFVGESVGDVVGEVEGESVGDVVGLVVGTTVGLSDTGGSKYQTPPHVTCSVVVVVARFQYKAPELIAILHPGTRAAFVSVVMDPMVFVPCQAGEVEV